MTAKELILDGFKVLTCSPADRKSVDILMDKLSDIMKDAKDGELGFPDDMNIHKENGKTPIAGLYESKNELVIFYKIK